jgi:hypothetical protein
MDQELADLFALLNGKWDPALQDHVIVVWRQTTPPAAAAAATPPAAAATPAAAAATPAAAAATPPAAAATPPPAAAAPAADLPIFHASQRREARRRPEILKKAGLHSG